MNDTRNRSGLSYVKTEGELLPPDILNSVLSNDTKMPGLDSVSYGLAPRERLNEAINRTWQRMCSLWNSFQEERRKLSNEKGTAQTRRYFLIPLFSELGYGRLQAATSEQRTVKNPIGGTSSYAISHMWENSPIHLVGCNIDIDKREPGVTGAAQASPHAIVQEFLNRSDDHLWGFVSNGLKLRILRDNACLSRQAYVEFDLESIFENQSFADFTLLWLLCHQSRVEKRSEEKGAAPKPEGCYLEQWTKKAQESALVALDTLSSKVEDAICILGQGFFEGNNELREKLQNRTLPMQKYFHELLRLVYRFIFCFVAEDRNLLHAPGTKYDVRERYDRYFSFRRIRQLSRLLVGTKHFDLYEGLKLVMSFLGNKDGCADLGLSPMGGFLWSDEAIPDLINVHLSNGAFLHAIRTLAWIGETSFTRFFKAKIKLRPIDYEHLGARELGSIYESLLESHPEIENGKFVLKRASGNERKKTGAYYTPAELINCLLESALDPVMERACRAENPETALLSLKVCDPACGSGHFLLAAAHRMGERLAKIRAGDDQDSSPEDIHKALRDVINRCIYGIDINPMSVELCKVSLWMESMEAGKPLTFLDHHIVCGNSLLGTNLDLIMHGLPEEAFAVLDGDDKEAVKLLKKQNKEDLRNAKQNSKITDNKLQISNSILDIIEASNRQKDKSLSDISNELTDSIKLSIHNMLNLRSFENMPIDTLEQIEAKEAAYRDYTDDPDCQRIRMLDDLWCAAFIMPRRMESEAVPFGITHKTIINFIEGKRLDPKLESAVKKVAQEYQFLHWDITFPEVSRRGGFDVILGNPPWERIKIQEKEWFASRNADIANASNAAVRGKMIARLKTEDPILYDAFHDALKVSNGASHYIRNSGRYPLCGRGDINLYAVFAENMRNMVNDHGRVGCIVPSGIATDDTTKYFFQDMVKTKSLVSLFDFENRRKTLFPAIDSRMKFCLLTTGNGKYPMADQAEFVFFALVTEDLNDKDRKFTLSSDDIALINPNTYTCPIFRTSKDAELTKAVYRRVPVLIKEKMVNENDNTIEKEQNTWAVKFLRMFDMANDSELFRTKEQLEKANGELQGNKFLVEKDTVIDTSTGELLIQLGTWLPLYEAKMIHHYNHRWSTYDFIKNKGKYDFRDVKLEELQDPNFCVMPRYWVHESNVDEKLKTIGWNKPWLMGWRDICRSTDERTAIGGILPIYAIGGTIPTCFGFNTNYIWILILILSSFVADFMARLKVGGTHLALFIAQQLAVLHPKIFGTKLEFLPNDTIKEFLVSRALELIYTSYEMQGFAEDLGYTGKPFNWDEKRRFLIRSELDALFFHLYLPSMPDGSWKKLDSESEYEIETLKKSFETPRNAVSYIMDSFPICKNRDEKMHNTYRTKDKILEIYDRMQLAMKEGIKYKSEIE
ncbi:MAG: N-6 DNA methylase [Desulfovibrionaceae bacterium]|nr:N-6 DNA methylase [Desulfovibrionaceae bacterium]